MPLLSAIDYVPQDDEAGMMPIADRETAMMERAQKAEAAGGGRIVHLADDLAWFVPSDPDQLGLDVVAALATPNMTRLDRGAILGAAFKNLTDNMRRFMVTDPIIVTEKQDETHG